MTGENEKMEAVSWHRARTHTSPLRYSLTRLLPTTSKMVTDELLVIKARLKKESEAREKEDNTLLDTMLFAQQRLQEAILHSFGAEAENIDLSNPTEAELLAARA